MQFRGRKSKIFTQKVREIQVGIIFFCLLVYVGLCYVGVFKENDVLNERTADTSEFKNIQGNVYFQSKIFGIVPISQ
jgi:hypothetical protein